MPSKEEEIQRYVYTGAYDSKHLAWTEESFFERTTRAHDELIEALFAEVQLRVKGKRLPVSPKMDLISFTRGKVESMVRGLFPKIECDAVLNFLQKSVIFLTAENIEVVLRRAGFLHTAWDLANLYLLSAGAEMLSAKAPLIVGMSVETTCYVSLEYFVKKERFADFVVHEAAHIFHNCHRASVGLKETRLREFLLNIEFCQRETFAYACEAYSRILELGRDRKERETLFEELDAEYLPPAEEVDIEKYKTALSAAVSARTVGSTYWKSAPRCRLQNRTNKLPALLRQRNSQYNSSLLFRLIQLRSLSMPTFEFIESDKQENTDLKEIALLKELFLIIYEQIHAHVARDAQRVSDDLLQRVQKLTKGKIAPGNETE